MEIKTTCRGKYIGLSLAGGSGDDEDHTSSCPLWARYLYVLIKICPQGCISSWMQAKPSPEAQGQPSSREPQVLAAGSEGTSEPVHTLVKGSVHQHGCRGSSGIATIPACTPHWFLLRILAQEGELIGAVHCLLRVYKQK